MTLAFSWAEQKAVRLSAMLDTLPAWLPIASLAAFLRLINIGQESPWYDETFTAWLSRLPIPQLWTAIQGDVHPPLWYAFSWVTAHVLGSTAADLRFIATIFSVASVAVIYHLAEQLGFNQAGKFIASGLAAVLPGLIYYGQEARMYSLLEFLVLFGALAAMRGQWRWFFVCLVATAYTQNLGMAYVAALAGAGIVSAKMQKQGIDRPLLCIGGAFALWLPWFFGVEIGQMRQMSGGFWITPLAPGDLFLPLTILTATLRLKPELLVLAIVAIYFAALIGLVVSRRWLLSPKGIYIAAILASPLGLAAASLIWRSVWLYRAMIPSAGAMCLVFGYLLSAIAPENYKKARVGLAVILAAALVSYYFPPKGGRTNWTAFFGPAQAAWQPGDITYYMSIDASIVGGYFMNGRAYALYPNATDLNQGLTRRAETAMGLRTIPFGQLCGMGYKRAWLVYATNGMISQAEIDEQDGILAAYPHSLKVDWTAEDDTGDARLYLVDPCAVTF